MAETPAELIGRGMGLVDDGDIPALLELMHPEIEWRPPKQGTLDTVYRGHTGVTQLFEQLNEAWGSIEHKPVKLVEGEDEVVVVTHINLHAQASDLEIDEIWAYAIELRDDKFFRVAMYTDPDEAIREHLDTVLDAAQDWPG
jgi:ketosteroid isomerase-like protein